LLLAVTALALVGCDQLGNPPQLTTGPTAWSLDVGGRIVTTTRSFKDEKTIRRLEAESLGELDHADPSIGPTETLTLVFAVPQRIPPIRRRKVSLVTIFKLPDRSPISRRWTAAAGSRRWSAAFAMPAPPIGAVTTLEP
jgi:hypothetical protein